MDLVLSEIEYIPKTFFHKDCCYIDECYARSM